jgi:hypothetical protein
MGMWPFHTKRQQIHPHSEPRKPNQMNILTLIATFLQVAEQDILPLFIHNPKSQKIEGVIVGTASGILTALGTQPAQPAPPVGS